MERLSRLSAARDLATAMPYACVRLYGPEPRFSAAWLELLEHSESLGRGSYSRVCVIVCESSPLHTLEGLAVKQGRVYVFEPVGLDVWDRRMGQPERGARVVKVQPAGCPRNGTMGHCFVADAETGDFRGLVLLASLRPERAR